MKLRIITLSVLLVASLCWFGFFYNREARLRAANIVQKYQAPVSNSEHVVTWATNIIGTNWADGDSTVTVTGTNYEVQMGHVNEDWHPFAYLRNISPATNRGWGYNLDTEHPTNIVMEVFHEPMVVKNTNSWMIYFK